MCGSLITCGSGARWAAVAKPQGWQAWHARPDATGVTWEQPGWAPFIMAPAVPRRRRMWPWVAMAVGVAVWAAGLAVIVAEHSALSSALGTTSPGVTLDQIRTGDCMTGSDLGLNTKRPWPYLTVLVPCSRPHLAEAIYTDASYWTGRYPGPSVLNEGGSAKCASEFAAYVGISESKSIYAWDYVLDTPSNWRGGDRGLYCIAYQPTSSKPGGVPVTGSIKDTRR